MARVVSQEDSHEWAKAGIMVKERLEVGAPYAALLLTPDHGVRLLWGFEHDVAGSEGGTAPRWLRLTRSGDVVTGYESSDATSWGEVGQVDLGELPSAVNVGLFVTSPMTVEIDRQFGGSAVFASPQRSVERRSTTSASRTRGSPSSGTDEWRDYDAPSEPDMGSSKESGGVFTLTGSGDIAEVKRPFGHDLVQLSLGGITVAALAARPRHGVEPRRRGHRPPHRGGHPCGDLAAARAADH